MTGTRQAPPGPTGDGGPALTSLTRALRLQPRSENIAPAGAGGGSDGPQGNLSLDPIGYFIFDILTKPLTSFIIFNITLFGPTLLHPLGIPRGNRNRRVPAEGRPTRIFRI